MESKKIPKETIVEEPTPECYIKCRHVLAFMLFSGLFNMYSMRVNLNVAIVAMVNLTHSSKTNVTDACPDRGISEIAYASNGQANWDPAQQGLVLGSYYYGYIITGVPGGYLANRIGVKLAMGIPMFLSSIITLLTPVLASSSFPMLVAGRILLGFLHGGIMPAIQSSWGKWAPPMERTRLIVASISGMSLGIFTTLLISGAVADNFGWEAVFYITGSAALLWCCIWFAIIHSWPQTHPRISIQEKTYILDSIGAETSPNANSLANTPWRRIFTSLPVWAIIVAHVCYNCGVYILMTMLPTYMATMLRFNVTKSGGFTAIPYILQFFVQLGSGYFSDELRQRRIMSTLNVRKLNTVLAAAVPASLMILAGYVGCDAKAAVALFSLAVAFSALTAAGYEANTVDVAPAFGGIVYGLSNSIANIPGFLAPQVAGFMLQKKESFGQWRNIFLLTAVVYAVGTVFYLIFATAEEQSWASGKNTKNLGENETMVRLSTNSV